jgi:hypothetical protein
MFSAVPCGVQPPGAKRHSKTRTGHARDHQLATRGKCPLQQHLGRGRRIERVTLLLRFHLAEVLAVLGPIGLAL